MGWTVRRSNPGGGEIFRTRPDRPWAHPTSYTVGTGSFLGVKRPGHGFDHPLLSSAEVRESTAVPLLPLWAFVACSRLNFTFTFTYKYSSGPDVSIKMPQ
jgi:hypothetical protein